MIEVSLLMMSPSSLPLRDEITQRNYSLKW